MSSKQCLNVVWFVVCFILAPFSLAHASGLEAGSWGGKVRAGPGKNYDQIGSLQNGDPVVLLKRFDVASSEYPWFELTFKEARLDISGAVSYALLNPLLRAFISSAKKITDR